MPFTVVLTFAALCDSRVGTDLRSARRVVCRSGMCWPIRRCVTTGRRARHARPLHSDRPTSTRHVQRATTFETTTPPSPPWAGPYIRNHPTTPPRADTEVRPYVTNHARRADTEVLPCITNHHHVPTGNRGLLPLPSSVAEPFTNGLYVEDIFAGHQRLRLRIESAAIPARWTWPARRRGACALLPR